MSKSPEEHKAEPAEEKQDGQPWSGEPKMNRRDFFTSLGTWSKIVIGGILLAGQSALPDEASSVMMPPPQQPSGQPTWVNIHRKSGTPPPNQKPPCNWGDVWDHVASTPSPKQKPPCNWGDVWDHVASTPSPKQKPPCNWGDVWDHAVNTTPQM